MRILSLLMLLAAADQDDGLAKKLLPIYVKEAAEYAIAVESAPQQALELKKEPVFEWSNPYRNDGQQGLVFLWLKDGRPSAAGCIFSSPAPSFPGARRIEHELHALHPERLVVRRDAFNQWKPQEGLAREILGDGGTPADAPGVRKLQMSRLAEGFTGHTIDAAKKRHDLRLLPTSIYRYPSARTGVVDGALFAIVSEAGTDPEVLLVIEAREVAGKLQWEYALCRFTDCEIHVSLKGKEVFSSIPSETNPYPHNTNHTYRTYQDKIVSLDGKLLARIRQDANRSQVVPVDEK